MRFEFIRKESANFPTRALCRTMGVSTSGYYAWRKRPPSTRKREDEQLSEKVRAIHKTSHGRYGSPRVHEALRKEQPISRKRVARLMRQEGLAGRPPARFLRTTDSDHDDPIAENLLARDFTADAPNTKWARDITCIWTDCGWMYLAVVIDLFSRRVVGWAMADHMRAELAIDALKMAIGRRCPAAGLIFHSDRGSQYTSRAYQALLRSNGALSSMSRKGNCWDNAPSESFFATLKKELIHRFHWLSRADAAAAVARYIEIFYNNQRLHSSIGYTSPAEFEAIKSTPQSAQLAA